MVLGVKNRAYFALDKGQLKASSSLALQNDQRVQEKISKMNEIEGKYAQDQKHRLQRLMDSPKHRHRFENDRIR